jgi:hypothetical protein
VTYFEGKLLSYWQRSVRLARAGTGAETASGRFTHHDRRLDDPHSFTARSKAASRVSRCSSCARCLGSSVEFAKIIGPLTDPPAHGGRPMTPSTW